MNIYTGKQNGKIYKGIYTTSGVPNHKSKRVRKTAVQETHESTEKIKINFVGIVSAILIGVYAPLSIDWKISIILLLIYLSIHISRGQE